MIFLGGIAAYLKVVPEPLVLVLGLSELPLDCLVPVVHVLDPGLLHLQLHLPVCQAPLKLLHLVGLRVHP